MTTIDFPVHTMQSAPAAARDSLASLQAAVGVIPNLAATMAESPELLGGFLALRELYGQSGFSPAEVQALSLVAAFENDCGWCMAFHTAMALKSGVSREAVDALRRGDSPSEPRLQILTGFAREMVKARGAVRATSLQAFLDAGFSQRQALNVVLGMAFSLMANYAGHLTDPSLDDFLKPHAWQR